jgi:hypothetical protein
MYKTEEKNLFDFINENNTPEIKVNSMVKKINEINEKATLRLNSVSIFNKEEKELFHYLAKHEKSF